MARKGRSSSLAPALAAPPTASILPAIRRKNLFKVLKLNNDTLGPDKLTCVCQAVSLDRRCQNPICIARLEVVREILLKMESLRLDDDQGIMQGLNELFVPMHCKKIHSGQRKRVVAAWYDLIKATPAPLPVPKAGTAPQSSGPDLKVASAALKSSARTGVPGHGARYLLSPPTLGLSMDSDAEIAGDDNIFDSSPGVDQSSSRATTPDTDDEDLHLQTPSPTSGRTSSALMVANKNDAAPLVASKSEGADLTRKIVVRCSVAMAFVALACYLVYLGSMNCTVG